MDENYATVLELVGSLRPDSIAISHDGRDMTWAELEDEASRVAAYLDDKGIGLGDRIAVAMFNGPWYLAALYAAFKVRAVPMNINYRYKADEIAALFDDGNVKAVFHDQSITAQMDDAMTIARSTPRAVVVLDGDTTDDVRRPYGDVLTSYQPMEPIERGDDEWLMYTGGTTGLPRGVLSRHSWLYDVTCANSFVPMQIPVPQTLDALREYHAGVGPDDYPMVSIPAAPLMHGTGVYNSLGVLVAGGRVAYLAGRSFDPDELLRLVEDQGADTVTIVGDVFARPLADAMERAAQEGRPYDLSSLVRMVSVGVTWSADAKQRILAHADLTCRDLVAASEGGPFAVNETRRGDETATGAFRLLPGCRILTETGEDVAPGTGEQGFLAAPTDEHIHYQNDETKTEATFKVFGGQRYVVPGDLASIAEDGTVTFHGRGSQVINTGGEKVFAEEVENAIMMHPDVVDVMVTGVPDERWGSRIAAVVATRPGAEVTLDGIREHVGGLLANYKRPTLLVTLDHLKRSPSGKADTRWAKQVAVDAAGEQGG